MRNFRSASFASLSKRLEQADSEMKKVSLHAAGRRDAILVGNWEAVTAAAAGVRNVYRGMEEILTTVARIVDGSMENGSSSRQDILDRMAADIPDVRHALLSSETHRNLVTLKDFHRRMHDGYGAELKGEQVLKKVRLLEKTYPEIVESLFRLEADLLAGRDPTPSPGPDI